MKKLIKSCKESYVFLFVISILISMEVYLLVTVFSGGSAWSSVFPYRARDSFMEFFNALREASQRGGLYAERGAVYPPMANLFFWLLSFLLPDAYKSAEAGAWSSYFVNIALVAGLLAIGIALIALLVYKSVKLPRVHKLLLTLTAVCSVPVLSMLERGGIMILAFILLFFYSVTYDHKNKFVRELGLISLALSASLELYPLVLVWVLASKKRFGDIARTVTYFLAFLILPSFAFGGIGCLSDMFKNIIVFSEESARVIAFISEYCHIQYNAVASVAYAGFFLAIINFILSPFIYRESWKIFAAGCIAVLSFPAFCFSHMWVLFIIPIILLCRDGGHIKWTAGGRRGGYLVCMLIPFWFMAVPLPLGLWVTVNTAVGCVAAVVIWAVSVYDTIRSTADKIMPRPVA